MKPSHRAAEAVDVTVSWQHSTDQTLKSIVLSNLRCLSGPGGLSAPWREAGENLMASSSVDAFNGVSYSSYFGENLIQEH